jgi:hypothetical protein
MTLLELINILENFPDNARLNIMGYTYIEADKVYYDEDTNTVFID